MKRGGRKMKMKGMKGDVHTNKKGPGHSKGGFGKK